MSRRMLAAPRRLVETEGETEIERDGRALLSESMDPVPAIARDRAYFGFVRRVQARPSPRRRAWTAIAVGAATAAMLFALALRPVAPARIVDVSGRVRVESFGERRTARADDAYALPVRIEVDRDSSAQIALARGVGIVLQGPAALAVAADEVRLESGRAEHDVTPGRGRFVVRLGDYRVVVKGTRFWTATEGDEAAVCLYEGAVDVVGPRGRLATLEPGEGWRSSEDAPDAPTEAPCEMPRAQVTTVVTSPEAAPAEPSPLEEAAEPAVRAHTTRQQDTVEDVASAAAAPAPAEPARPESCDEAPRPQECLRRIADGTGLAAETALYRLGQLFQARGDRQGALDAWLEYRERFPNGALGQEADLSIIDLRLALGSPLALRAAERFLDVHPGSEHEGEVRAIRGVLRHRAGDAAGALADYEAALAARTTRARREESLFGRAACLDVLGRTEEAASAYRAYLEAFPSGRFAGRASLALPQDGERAP